MNVWQGGGEERWHTGREGWRTGREVMVKDGRGERGREGGKVCFFFK